MATAMDVDGTSSYEPLIKFANVLKDFKISSLTEPGSRDVFDLVKDFRSIAGEGAMELANSSQDDTKEQFENWELEAKLWHLIELLVNYRTADLDLSKGDDNSQINDRGHTRTLLENNRSLYELWLIMVWIQSNVRVSERPDGMGSSKWSNSVISGSLQSCDLDYPLRNPDCKIDNRDKESDHTFFKYAYNLILAGKFDEVRKECEYTDNLGLALILCGLDSNTDLMEGEAADVKSQNEETIKGKALWRRAVHSLSLNTELDKYERAIYSFLAGDVIEDNEHEMLNWDTELLVYLNQSWQTALEKNLMQNNLIDTKDLILPMASEQLSLQTILDIVSQKHVSEGEHPIRVLMAAIMLDKVSSVVKSSVSMLLEAVKGAESSNDMFEEPYLLRVVTHLVIFMDSVCPGSVDQHDKSRLVTAYVTILSLYQLYDIIPVYISFLGEAEALEAYSFFLSNISDPAARQRQLELCNILEMPTANILRRTTQRVFDDTENFYSPTSGISVDVAIDDIDKRLITTSEWLVVGKLYSDAIDSLIVLSRRFLLNGKTNALRYLYESQDLDELIKNFEMQTFKDNNKNSFAIAEIQQYKKLVDLFSQFEKWDQLTTTPLNEASLPHLLNKFKNLSNDVYKFTKFFLTKLSESELIADRDIIYEIRALYTPHLIIQLHKALVSASQTLKISS